MATPPEKWQTVKTWFDAALELDSGARAAFLRDNCPDAEARAEVERLLNEHDEAGRFLSNPVLDNFSLETERAAPSQRLSEGKVLAGRFRIVRFIAGGGMGEVYEAEDQELRERVAVKTIKPEILAQPNALTRFKREVRLARQVTHPNVCRIFDLFRHKGGDHEHEDVVFIGMELLPGKTLGAQLEEGGRMSMQEALPLVRQMASALAAAHAAGIVHRDFKPGNVVLTGPPEQCRAVVTDFGLALRSLASDKDATASTVDGAWGTPAYMAPEQLEGRPATTASDIYALGLVIYEMVTGARPFQGDTPISAALKRLSEPPTPPHDFQPGLSPVWESVILRCLERDPEKRFTNAADVVKALEGDHVPSSAEEMEHQRTTQPGSLLSPRSWWRSSAAIGAGSLIVLFSILALASYLWRLRSPAGHSALPPVYQQITFLGNAFAPAISPDGTFVAYVTAPPGGDAKLMMQAMSGGPSLELFHAKGIVNAAWSPDGSELLVSAWEISWQKGAIFVVSRLGGVPRRVVDGRTGACWTPDGSQLVGVNSTPEADGGGIRLIDKNTGAQKQIHLPSYDFLGNVDCSVKTGNLLILVQASGKSQIWTLRPDGTEQRKLVEDERGISSPRWNRSGDAVYYLRGDGNAADLVRIPVPSQSEKPAVLANGLETGGYFTLSADGSQLVYTREHDYSNLWLAELQTSGPNPRANIRPLTSGTLSYSEPSISPDGRWLAFSIDSGAKSNIYKMAMDGGQPVQITFFDGALTASPSWSPDGRRLAFICDQGGAGKVWLVSAEGGKTVALDMTNPANSNNKLSWFPSTAIVYQQGDLHNLHRVDPDTQKDELVLRANVDGWLPFRPIPSPDGKKIAIYWNRRSEPGLFVITLDVGTARLVYPGDYVPIGWSPSGKFIYATKGLAVPEVVSIGLENSKGPRPLVTMPGDFRQGAVSPDGRKIIANVAETKSDVWVIKNFDPQITREKQPD